MTALPFSMTGAPGLGGPTTGAVAPTGTVGGPSPGVGGAVGAPSLGNLGTGVNIGSLGRLGLTAAGMVPGPIGLVAGLANMGLHGYNVAADNQNLSALGLAPLGFGQTLGAMLGLNGYANGTPMGFASAIGAQMPAAISNALAGRANAMAFGANPGGGFVGPGNSPAAPGVSASGEANNGMAAGPV